MPQERHFCHFSINTVDYSPFTELSAPPNSLELSMRIGSSGEKNALQAVGLFFGLDAEHGHLRRRLL